MVKLSDLENLINQSIDKNSQLATHLEIPTGIMNECSHHHINSNEKLLFGLIYTMFIEGRPFNMLNHAIHKATHLSIKTITRSIKKLADDKWIIVHTGKNNRRVIKSINVSLIYGLSKPYFVDYKNMHHIFETSSKYKPGQNVHTHINKHGQKVQAHNRHGQSDHTAWTNSPYSMDNLTRQHGQNVHYISHSHIRDNNISHPFISQSSSSVPSEPEDETTIDDDQKGSLSSTPSHNNSTIAASSSYQSSSQSE